MNTFEEPRKSTVRGLQEWKWPVGVAVLVLLPAVLFSISPVDTPFGPPSLFQKHSTWYERIPAGHPLLPDSSERLEYMRGVTNSKSIGFGYREWSPTVWFAAPGTPLVTVEYGHKWAGVRRNDGSEPTPEWVQRGWGVVPIPPEAVPPANDAYVRGEYRDNHMLVVSGDGTRVWDFFRAAKWPDGGWTARVIRLWDLTGDGVDQPWSGISPTRVAPVPTLHGLVRREEISRGFIGHALALAIPPVTSGGEGVFPCRREGRPYGAKQHPLAWEMGYRVRWDPNFNVDSLQAAPWIKTVLRALQDYGAICVEYSGGSMSLYFESEGGRPGLWKGVFTDQSITQWFELTYNFRHLQIVEPVLPGAAPPPNSKPAPPTNLRIVPASAFFEPAWRSSEIVAVSFLPYFPRDLRCSHELAF